MSSQFNVIALILIPVIFWPVYKRIKAFDWTLTLIANILVVFGTWARVHQIYAGHWNGLATGNTEADVEWFFTCSLAAWIACVVLDGRHSFTFFELFGLQNTIYFFKQLYQTPTRWQKFQVVCVAVSFLTMLLYGISVFASFGRQTTNTSVHVWFLLAVVFKTIRIVYQGMNKETPYNSTTPYSP